jgi:zeta toxin
MQDNIMSISINQENEAFNKIWAGLTSDKSIKQTETPKGYVLGGQPGAGKSNLITLIQKRNNYNILVINGDEFRQYHPKFNEIQAEYGKDAPKHTAEFAGRMTGRVIEKALEQKLNIVVEGTFRTAETPLKTLSDMKENNYSTSVYIMTTSAQKSWNGTLERYDKMLAAGQAPRYTDKAHHDKVVAELPKNADIVFKSGKADDFKVYSREGLIFDKQKTPNELPSKKISAELHPTITPEIVKKVVEKAVQQGQKVTVYKPIEQAKIQDTKQGETQKQSSPKPKL